MADILWTGNGDGRLWNDAANWDTNTVPTAADNVTINGSSVIIDTNTTIATLNLSGGVSLFNSSQLDVTTLNWTGGAFDNLSGNGSINIPEAGTLNISGTTVKRLDTTINNAGSATLTSGVGTSSTFGSLGTFNNSGQFDIQGSHTLNVNFNNTGTVTKSADNGTATFQQRFDNSGILDIQTGSISLSSAPFNTGGGINSGTFNVAEGTTLEVAYGVRSNLMTGTLVLNPGTTFTGTGLVKLSTGTIAVQTSPATPINIANFTQEGSGMFSTLTGSGSLNITENLNWTGGTQEGGGSTTLAAGAIGNMSNTSIGLILNRTLNNQGTVNWTGGLIQSVIGVFNNSGTFNIQNSGTFPAGFNNSGTVTKSVDTGATNFQNIFNNTGTVDVQTGTLTVQDRGGSSTGTYNIADGAILEFRGEPSNAHNLNEGTTFTGQGLVQLTGGSINVETDANSEIAIANFEQTGGAINGTGNFRVAAPTPAPGETPQTSSFTWSGGVQAGTGTTTIEAGTTANINGTDTKTLAQRTFNNESTIAWTDTGNISAQDGATFNNIGNFDIQNSQSFLGDNEDGSTFNNTGTVTKSADPGATDFENNTFNNTGTVDVQTGTLIVGDGSGSSTGTFNTADTTIVKFDGGSNTLNEGTTFTGQGLVQLTDGNLNVETAANSEIAIPNFEQTGGTLGGTGNFQVANFEQTGGTLGGTGNFRVAVPTPAPGETPQSSSFIWSGGSQAGTGTTTIEAGTTANINGTDTKTLAQRTFNNESTITWADTGNLSAQDGATFNNIGNFDIQNSESFLGDNEDGSTFNNSGTVTKTLSPGASDFENNVFNNTGTVDAQTGSIVFGNGSSSGTFHTIRNTTIQFDSGTHTLNHGTAFTGSGFPRLSGGRLTVGDTANDTINAINFEQTNGTINGPGNFTTTGTFDWSGGTQSGVGSTTIGATGTLNITGNTTQTISERTIDNNGTTNWLGTGNISANNGAIFNNNGTFNIANTATYNGESFSDAEQFNNNGTLVKTSPGDTKFKNVVFTNSGAIEIQQGNLSVPPINGTNDDDELSEGAENNIINGLGGNDNISGLGGNDTLRGGTGNDEVLGNRGNDRINGGEGNDTILGGIGNDRLMGVDGDDVLIGGPGNDIMLGGNGADILEGRPGRDRLNGGLGPDTMTGGVSRDLFIFNTNTAFSTEIGVDTIVDFTSGEDLILLNTRTFTALSAIDSGIDASEFEVVTTDAAAATSGALITYNSNSGALFYNQNGNATGLGNGGQFALLESTPVLETADFRVR
ncbi:MAG: calcium-binding protein [Cyanobacteria bacterium P01_H01_bin.35]